MTSLLTRTARRSVKWCAFFLVGTLLTLPQAAQAQLRVSFGSLHIFDGGAGDIDPAPNVIGFNGIYGPANYHIQGTLTQVAGPSGISASFPLSLTLTNFIATAVPTSTVGMPTDISIESNTVFGSFGVGTAADQVSAEVGHFGGLPVAANTDFITSLYTIINDSVSQYPIATATGAPVPVGNPAFGGGFGSTPYPLTGHVNSSIPATFNPKLLGVIGFTLGAIDDQLIMPSSFEIGYQATPVPEPSTMMLIGLAGFSAVLYCKNRRKVA